MRPRSLLAPVALLALLGTSPVMSETTYPSLQGETSMTATTLKVPGATLYYETSGTGPVLLVIPGGPQDAGVFADLAAALATRYTVVPYDPRGNSRSTFDGAPTELSLDQQADDAAALITHLGQGPVHVFGTSGGAQIGLNLTARHPDLVQALVVHEPPSMMLLDDPAADIAATDGLYEIYKTQGVDAAMGAFFGGNALDGPEGGAPEGDAPPDFDMPPEAAETMGRVMGNFDYWLAHGMRPLSFYTPDVAALQAKKVVVGISAGSDGQPIARMSNALAAKLGVTPVSFPGDHITAFDPPNVEQFADVLDGALRN